MKWMNRTTHIVKETERQKDLKECFLTLGESMGVSPPAPMVEVRIEKAAARDIGRFRRIAKIRLKKMTRTLKKRRKK